MKATMHKLERNTKMDTAIARRKQTLLKVRRSSSRNLAKAYRVSQACVFVDELELRLRHPPL